MSLLSTLHSTLLLVKKSSIKTPYTGKNEIMQFFPCFDSNEQLTKKLLDDQDNI